MSESSNFPTVMPSLLLDFANAKQLDPRITFTRASTATYYDEDTVALAEQNLLLQSQAFNESVWNKSGATVIANTVTAPDGTTTAETITCTATSGIHEIYQNATLVAGSPYVMSVFVKKNTHDFVQLRHYNAAGGATRYANFNVATGVLGTVGADATASITDAGNGWYRCVMIASPTNASTGHDFFIIDSKTAASAAPFTAVGTESVYVWGAQLEQRSAVTAYTATTTQPITNYIPVLMTAAVGVPRFIFNPTTRESLGLLIEEQRTNAVLQSEDFSTTWAATRATISTNSRVSPNGTITADKLIASTDNNTHFVSQTFTGTAASWTFSVYAKAVEYGFIALRLFNGTSQVGLAYYNLFTGATGAVTAGTAAISSVGNGWYRCALTATLAASASCTADVQLASADNTNSFAGNAWNGVSLWGAQLEAGAFPTSYIPTVASSVTRSADTASMTEVNFSQWYRADEGTFYSEANTINSSSARWILAASAVPTTNADQIDLRINTSGTARAAIIVGSVQQAQMTSATAFYASQAYAKQALAFKFNDAAMSANGATVITDTSCVLPTVAYFYIGSQLNGGTPLNGTIKKIAYYPWRLTNAQLQALTS